MNLNNRLFKFLNDFLESIKRTYLASDFAYSSYNPPNTMLDINNKLPEILLTLEPAPLKLYLICLTMLKRNHEPTMAIIVHLTPEAVKDEMSRPTYFKAKKTLIELDLLHKTPKPSVMIVNPTYANKLFKPKLDLPDIL